MHRRFGQPSIMVVVEFYRFALFLAVDGSFLASMAQISMHPYFHAFIGLDCPAALPFFSSHWDSNIGVTIPPPTAMLLSIGSFGK